MGKNSQLPNPPLIENETTSDDPRDEHRPSDTPGAIGKAPVETPDNDVQNQATIEELRREGLGIAPKE